MNILYEIKEEFAVGSGYSSWEEMINDTPNYQIEHHTDQVAEHYLMKVVKKILEKASENACDSLELHNSEYEILKKAILTTKIEPK